MTVRTDLLMRVKDAVGVLNGWPHHYTIARFVEEAYTVQLERLKADDAGHKSFLEQRPATNCCRQPHSRIRTHCTTR